MRETTAWILALALLIIAFLSTVSIVQYRAHLETQAYINKGFVYGKVEFTDSHYKWHKAK